MREVLQIVHIGRSISPSTILEETQVNHIVENVINTIKEELPEEAQTVEVLDYITDRIREALKEKRIKL